MIVWLYELQVAIIFRQEALDVFRGLIIHDVELRLEPFRGEFVEVFFVGPKNCFVVQTFDGGGKDEVGLVMVQHEKTDAAVERDERERSRQVVVDEAARFVGECPKTKNVGNGIVVIPSNSCGALCGPHGLGWGGLEDRDDGDNGRGC